MIIVIAAIAALALLVLASRCFIHWPHRGTFRGRFTSGFETSSFIPCGKNERWWVSGNTQGFANALAAQRPPGVAAPAYPWGSVYARVRARVSWKGRYGHMGGYVREMDVLEVIEAGATPPSDCR